MRVTRKIKDSVGIWLVLFLAASLRVANLISDKAFWDDELFSVLLARKPFWNVLYGAIADVHPPGHLILLHAFYSLLGNQDWVYRLPSVLAGCALVGVVYFLGREFFEKTSALLASFLVAIAPYFIQLSNEARSYSLATLVITLMSCSLIKSLRSSETRWQGAYTFTAILGVYIDHFAWIWLFTANLFLLGNKAFKKFFQIHLRILFYGIPALLLTLGQIIFTEEKHILLQRSHSYFLIIKKILAVLWHAATGYGYSGWSKESLAVYSADPLFWLALAAYGSFLIAVIFAMIKARKEVSLFVSFSSLAPLVLICALFPTVLEARYVSFAIPPLFIFAAAGFRQWKYGSLGLPLWLLLSLFLTFKTLAMPWDPIHREDDRAALAYAFKSAGESDAVCGSVRPVEYYGPQEKTAHYYPSFEEINFKQRYRRIFLLEPPLYVDPSKDHKRLDAAKSFLARQGYSLAESADFGREGVRTFVHRFEPKSE